MKNALFGLAAGTLAVTAVLTPAPAYAQYTPVSIDLNQSYYLNTGRSITRVAIANPKIADVSLVDRSSLNIIGISPGTTTLNVWASNGYRYEYRVTVSNQDSGLAKIVQEAIDLPGVRVQMIGGKILLRGAVKNQYERDFAYKIAKLYAGTGGSSGGSSSGKSQSGSSSSGSGSLQSLGSSLGSSDDSRGDIDDSVVNMLEMTNPDQINIEAMFVELSSTDAKNLGINYASQDMSDTDNNGITMNNAGTFYAGESYGSQRSAGSHWYNRNWLFTHFSKINAEIHALIENGKARVVSRPNVTTMSGKDAKILIGGEIPYESSNGFGSTTTEYKEYGIGLDLKAPTVDQDGNITTVNIPSGMTMVIGGLLNSDDAKTIQKVPLLGNIPLLGELFKYHNNSHTRTEIVVLITPRVVSEETPARMSADMEDAYNDSRREDRSMKQVDLNGEIPEKSNEQLAQEAKAAEKAARKNAKAASKSSALTTRVETESSEAPGDRIKASAREILSHMDK